MLSIRQFHTCRFCHPSRQSDSGLPHRHRPPPADQAQAPRHAGTGADIPGQGGRACQAFRDADACLGRRGIDNGSGTQGQRGYTGDYLFAWIGCTTPLDPKVWRVMAQLGSRLFFYSMDDRPAATDADLLATDVGESYRERLDRCRRHVGRLLSEVFEANGSVRGVKWDAAGDPSVVRQWLSRLARLVAAGRSEPSRDGDDSPGSYEAPHRAYAVL